MIALTYKVETRIIEVEPRKIPASNELHLSVERLSKAYDRQRIQRINIASARV